MQLLSIKLLLLGNAFLLVAIALSDRLPALLPVFLLLGALLAIAGFFLPDKEN